MSDLPSKFMAHYECENCGEGYEMWNFRAPRIAAHCDLCDEKTIFEFVYLEHKIWEWKIVEDIWASQGGLTLPDESDN